MKYKTKLVFLMSFIAVCVLMLIASFMFNPQNMNARNSMYTWLDKTWLDQADRIAVKGAGSEPFMLIRKAGLWFVLAGQTEYPAKQEQLEDLFHLLSLRTSYPVRSTSQSSHERLGVTEQQASRIVVFGGVSQIPLLDLLIGSGNSAGNEIYLRKNGTNEVRSGADQFTHFSDAKQSDWFDLKLLPGDIPLSAERVQQISVYKNTSGREFSYTLSRYADAAGTSWKIISSPNVVLDDNKVETFIRTILTSEAVDFAVNNLPSDYDFTFGKLELLLDDLSRITISLAPETENALYPAMVSGNNFVYLIPKWNTERLFREAEYFAAEQLP